ncbi:cysteine hydrolase family protein [Microbacter margulisiae]|uniref:Nicotinamidase-related amidase n=1 Tax=Microbacter margulisiae TaxID=1350067 RepID=A0A7W5H2K2_9PORP|nr:isochorismatase family cysteine hydrolase [Microbacter margulisiae]MBB3187521.1 nicotinamidase-related amidase [Microbacter margulisiae]
METNNNDTALLVMDMQVAILRNLPDAFSFTSKVAQAIAHARAKSIPVIYVIVGFRPGMPEVSVNNKRFEAMRERLSHVGMDEWMAIEPAIAPLAEEVVVTKHRVSAFTGSDLEVILRAQGIHRLILTGIATSGVVLSTLREAADKDYQLTVLSDGCADGDPEVHHVLTTKVFPRQAEVITVDEWEA